MRAGLTVVGFGIQFGTHFTRRTLSIVRGADEVFYLFDDPANDMLVNHLRPDARDLRQHYLDGRPLDESYNAMIEEILHFVRRGKTVCVALYGHPGVFAYPTHEAIRVARAEGWPARMLPGVSAEDCLFADLGVDPGNGCQSYEAVDFLVCAPRFDARRSLILWQVGGIGELRQPLRPRNDNLRILAEELSKWYPADHATVVYEAARYAFHEPSVQNVLLAQLPSASVNARSTLYIPPYGRPQPMRAMIERLRVDLDEGIS